MSEKNKIIESYTVESNFVIAVVDIYDIASENVPIYHIQLPKISESTRFVLDKIKDELSEESFFSAEDVNDPKKLYDIKKHIFEKSLEKLTFLFPNSKDPDRKAFAGIIIQEMYGFGELDIVMSDNFLEEVCINRSDQPICVYHKKYGWVKTTIFVKDEEQIYNYSSMIGRKVGRDINSLNPIMDAHLTTGDRVAATLFPISSSGNTITFRRFSRSPWTVTHMVTPVTGVMTYDMASLLWQALEYELNILVCGGTASGKTSILNALCALLPKNQRILSVEDTREFILPEDLNWNWVPMSSRKENSEGHGSITMLDLTVAALRMRPDRIIVGEVRKKEQAETMFEAMHTGHSVYTTMHADTVEQMVRRLLEPPIQIPKNEVEALHIILVQHRDRQRNVRRTLEIAEIVRGGISDNDLKTNYLYRWRPRTDEFEMVEEPTRIIEDLNLRTGMTPDELNTDRYNRVIVLKWMVKNKLYDTDLIGKLMKFYYKDKQKFFNEISDGTFTLKFLEEAD